MHMFFASTGGRAFYDLKEEKFSSKEGEDPDTFVTRILGTDRWTIDGDGGLLLKVISLQGESYQTAGWLGI